MIFRCFGISCEELLDTITTWNHCSTQQFSSWYFL